MSKKRILTVLTLIQIIVILSMSSYSWFADKSNPTITENAIRVTSADGLAIKLQPDSEARMAVNLNEIIDQYEQFELKQVSSADAVNFYYIDFGQGLGQSAPQFVEVLPNPDGSIDMVKYGFISYDFYLQTENFAKHVYLHKDTAFTGTASTALRVAVSITQGETTTRRIFGDTVEDGTGTYPYLTQAIIRDGEFDYYDIDPTFISTQTVNLLSSRNGGRGTSDDDVVDQGKLLVNIPANSQVKVNVKVWLEGGDEDCTPLISSSNIDLAIKFGSANILLDAPNLTPNNSTNVINGLATTMEYAFTNTSSTVWTEVSNPSMTFTDGQTVYVRIAEVANVSPASNVRTVVFS